jgi:hypothetical protein
MNLTFPVFAALTWNILANFTLTEKSCYTIVANNSQTWCDGNICSDASGYGTYFDPVSNCYVSGGTCRSRIVLRHKAAKRLRLICGVKDDDIDVEESTLLDITDIGLQNNICVKHSGSLSCYANDGYTGYWNNRGKIDVSINVVS